MIPAEHEGGGLRATLSLEQYGVKVSLSIEVSDGSPGPRSRAPGASPRGEAAAPEFDDRLVGRLRAMPDALLPVLEGTVLDRLRSWVEAA